MIHLLFVIGVFICYNYYCIKKEDVFRIKEFNDSRDQPFQIQWKSHLIPFIWVSRLEILPLGNIEISESEWRSLEFFTLEDAIKAINKHYEVIENKENKPFKYHYITKEKS